MLKKSLLLLLVVRQLWAQHPETDVSIVQSYIQSKPGMSSLNAMLCWEAPKLISLVKAVCFEAEKTLCAALEIAEENLPTAQKGPNSIIVMDLGCSETWSFLKSVKMKQFEYLEWIFLHSGHEKGVENMDTLELDFLELMSTKNVGPGSEITYVTTKNGEWYLKQVYRPGRNDPPSVELSGIWSDGKLTDFRSSPITSKRRKDLSGTLIRASLVILNNDSVNHLSDYRHTEVDSISKVNYVLTNHLMRYLNASIRFSMVPTWGYYNKTKQQYSGLIGELTRDESDVGGTAMFFTLERIPLVQYLALPTRTQGKFIFQSPKLSYTDNVFVLPFSGVVWVCVIMLIPVIGISLAIVTFAEWKFPFKEHNPEDTSILRPSVNETIQLVFGALCQQGSSVVPGCISARILVFISFLILMFLYASYSANIVALLQAPSTKIKELEDLLYSRLKLGVDDTVYNRFYFPRQTEGVKRLIYTQKVNTPDGTGHFMSLSKGISKIQYGHFAFYAETGPAYKLISRTFDEDEKCGLLEIPYLDMIDPYYAIQKNSTYKELMKVGFYRLVEHGLSFRENSRIYTKKPSCSGTGGKFIPVSVIDVEPALLLLCWGFGIAIVAFVVESTITNKTIRGFLTRTFSPVTQLK